MKLRQPQNLLKSVILAVIYIIILNLPVSLQYSSYYAIATTEHHYLSSAPTTTSTSTKNMPQKEDDESIAMTELFSKRKTTIIGAWDRYQMPLEKIQGTNQRRAMETLLEQGFREYYFVMKDFNDSKIRKATERLLKSADKTDLKIMIILLPPSEGGPNGNYNWKGWIDYFNILKDKHKSFKGFTIDDFNWISTRNDTKFSNNIDYMIYSNLSKALYEKSKDLQFYPVIYFEGAGTNIVIAKYSRFIDGVILASACYYNITNLKQNLLTFSRMFDNEPIRYVVYPTTTYNYTKHNYNPPSDRLVMATLSIATKVADGILIWRKTDSQVVKDYLSNHDDREYLSRISMVEKLQIRDELIWRKANPSLTNSILFQRHCHL
jgi:hypothetical protein